MYHCLRPLVLLSAAPELCRSTPRFLRSQAIMVLSAGASGSILDGKLSTMETGSLFILPALHKAPEMRRASYVRAEGEYSRSRASSSMPETAPGRKKTNNGSNFGDADESEYVSVWDSNAEGIRRSWRTNRTASVGSRTDENRSNGYVPDAESSWQWWRNGPDDDDYEDDTDDDDEEDSMFSFFDLENFDVLSAFSMLRWLLPAAAVFLPWLFGGPMFLMMAFALFPLLQKLLGLFVPSSWKAALQGRSTRSGRKQGKRSQPRKGMAAGFWGRTGRNPIDNSREEQEEVDPYNEDWESSFVRSSGGTSELGGWDQEEDILTQRRVTRSSKKGALQKRRSRKEAPLFWRLLVALFPFLRSWGGLL